MNQTFPLTIRLEPIPAFAGALPADLREQMTKAVKAWKLRTPSPHTRRAYASDLDQFLAHAGIEAGAWEKLAGIRPDDVTAWRVALTADEQTNSTIRRKLTALRSLFSYLKTYGYTGANPARSDFVSAPAVARDGKTVGLSPHDCRRLLDAPQLEDRDNQIIPVGVRDRAMFAVLAYSGCRVGELVKLRVRDYRTNGEHRVLNITGKGNKDRTTPLHLEALEKLAAWLALPGVADDPAAPLFRPQRSGRKNGKDGFRPKPMTTRAVEKLIERYVKILGLDANVTVHSLRVTPLTTARERGSDIIDLQDFAGHADPRTTLTYIRSRDRLSKSFDSLSGNGCGLACAPHVHHRLHRGLKHASVR
jgi:integrase/recombinase XerD